MTDKYILDGHTPVLEPDLFTWAAWFERAGDLRLVAESDIAGTTVVTYFLGLDFSFSRQPHVPLLFETVVCGGPWAGEGERCSTWQEAEAQHQSMVQRVQTPKPPADPPS